MNHHWTPSEISYIKEKYPTVQTKVIAKRLNVTETQVRGVIKRYGLKKREPGKSSTNDEKHYYLREGFWQKNTFWRTAMHTPASREYFEQWLMSL